MPLPSISFGAGQIGSVADLWGRGLEPPYSPNVKEEDEKKKVKEEVEMEEKEEASPSKFNPCPATLVLSRGAVAATKPPPVSRPC